MIRLDARDPDFDAAFDALVDARREADADVGRDVAAILSRVRSEGDAALHALTQKFDGHDLDATGWRIECAEWAAAHAALPSELRDALHLAHDRIRAFHQRQRPADSEDTDDTGTRTGSRWRAVDAAGVYVPGGRAAYPSSLLMNAVPAKVAGVERLVVVTPTPNGEINPLVLAAAHIAEVDEMWRVGGAQAVAALAYGTASIAPVDVVTGPGNAWVAEAKRQLYGVVGIDMVAGPSEIVVVADAANDPEWIAADLLSQAEHDVTTQSILFTDDAAFADAVAGAVGRQLSTLATERTARAAWEANGAIILVATLTHAIALCDRLAPEHLQIATDDANTLFAHVRHAGSVFIGRHTPEAVGDYVAGPNHVLPTGRRARFASGLSVLDFMKRTSFLECDEAALGRIGPRRRRACRCRRAPRGTPARWRSGSPAGKAFAMSTRTAARSRARAAARLAAVQALYQHDMEATPIAKLLTEFHHHRLGATIEDAEYAEADVDFFDDVVSGAQARLAEIDGVIAGKLASGWPLARLDKPMKAILRAGTYELLARADVPAATVITEYVDVAHAFYEKREAGFVNGVLDGVAKQVRN